MAYVLHGSGTHAAPVFHRTPYFRRQMLLLQERIPKASAFYVQAAEVADVLKSSSEVESQSG